MCSSDLGFVLDLLLYSAEALGLVFGLVFGFWASGLSQTYGPMLAFPLIGLGLGTILKALVLFPDPSRAIPNTILDLMSDPYASPLRGIPAKLNGTVIGRGEAGYVFGSDLQFQDSSGLLFLRYVSRFGPIGQFLFGIKRVQSLIGSQASVDGWFRRGVASHLDLLRFRGEAGTVVNSYPRFWTFLFGGGLILLGAFLGSV